MMATKPFASDPDAWKKHFLDMASGKLRNASFYRLGRTSQYGGSTGPTIELVTPTQQAIEMAKSEQKQQESKSGKVKNHVKRKSPHSTKKLGRGKTKRKEKRRR